MRCSHPMRVWYAAAVNPSGRRSLTWDSNKALNKDTPLFIPCGKCMRCKVRRSHEWSARAMHEASLYDDNVFVTVTYSPENLPPYGTLVKADYQNFLKRLRKYAVSRRGRSFKFMVSGEYGEVTSRPHYHFILFDFDFKDKKFFRRTKAGYPVYTSEKLSEIWGLGLSEVGSVTPDSATYVAGYCTKIGLSEDVSKARYGLRLPEFGDQSQGFGFEWLKMFHTDIYNYDRLLTKNGITMNIPRYYDSKYELLYPEEAAAIKAKRMRWKTKRDDSFARFCAREEITLANIREKRKAL